MNKYELVNKWIKKLNGRYEKNVKWLTSPQYFKCCSLKRNYLLINGLRVLQRLRKEMWAIQVVY